MSRQERLAVEPISSDEMRAIELNAEYLGISRLQLMENAGLAVAREIANRFKRGTSVTIFAGTGGNGGDGLVAARHLVAMGFDVDVILAGKPDEVTNEATKKNWEIVQRLKRSIRTHIAYDSSLMPRIKAEVIVDALLGIGTRGELRPPILQLVRKINQEKGFKVAIDVPTGIDADSGEVLGDCVKADLTITFHRLKKGLLKAKEYVGELVVSDIGIPIESELYAGPGDVILVRKERRPEAHKGEFGRLLVIGGSEIFSGAPALVALSALRVGVDLAYIAAPRDTAYAISSMSPNFITIKLEGEHFNTLNVGVIEGILSKVNAVVMGPGLGRYKETKEAVKEAFSIIEGRNLPLLLDADALKAFAEFKRKVKNPVVLTPHAGEYKILTGIQPSRDLEERGEQVKKSAGELNACILLKGHVDVISDGTRVKLNLTGNPGMTVGGTGDTLAGIVGAFLAQGIDPFRAAVAGAFINGAAGDFVLRERGYHMVPTDLIDWIGKVIDDPMSHIQVRREF